MLWSSFPFFNRCAFLWTTQRHSMLQFFQAIELFVHKLSLHLFQELGTIYTFMKVQCATGEMKLLYLQANFITLFLIPQRKIIEKMFLPQLWFAAFTSVILNVLFHRPINYFEDDYAFWRCHLVNELTGDVISELKQIDQTSIWTVSIIHNWATFFHSTKIVLKVTHIDPFHSSLTCWSNSRLLLLYQDCSIFT